MKKKKIIITVISILIVLCLMVAGYLYYQNEQREQIYKGMTISFKEQQTLEYGDTNFRVESLVKSSSGKITAYPKLDALKIGEQQLVFTMSEKGVTKEFSTSIVIKDTKKPVIKLKEEIIYLNYGDDFDARTNIVSVKDVVDGDLVFSEKDVENSYVIHSDVDTKKAGTYTIKIVAKDKNGNKTEASYDVVVAEETQETIPPVEPQKPQEGTTSNKQVKKTTEPYYIDGVLLVNKNHGLPSNFGSGADSQAYAALQKLQKGAAASGHDMPLLSGNKI